MVVDGPFTECNDWWVFQSLLGDAQPISQRLPAKFRLGQVGDSANFLKRGHLSSSNTTAVSASKSTPNNRSRWRLERDENGNPVSGDEDDDDDDEEEVVDVETLGNDGEANPHDEADEGLSKKRFRPPDFDDIDDSFVRNVSFVSCLAFLSKSHSNCFHSIVLILSVSAKLPQSQQRY